MADQLTTLLANMIESVRRDGDQRVAYRRKICLGQNGQAPCVMVDWQVWVEDAKFRCVLCAGCGDPLRVRPKCPCGRW